MRDYTVSYINGKRHQIDAEHSTYSVAQYLRYQKQLTGTKIVCSEGDCGACTILIGRPDKTNQKSKIKYYTINSCISFMYLMDGFHIVTVEGLATEDTLHPVQTSMIENHGAQCGYCTPGIVCSLAGLLDKSIIDRKVIDDQATKNALTGNLCRCTGYLPILESAKRMNIDKFKTLSERYHSKEMVAELNACIETAAKIETDKVIVNIPTTLDELLEAKIKGSSIISGASDLGVLVNKEKISLPNIISLSNIEELKDVLETDDAITIGAQVSLTEIEDLVFKDFSEFSKMIRVFASPQIKNIGTLVGNLVNASPIADTIPFLLVAEATLNIRSKNKKRELNINDFYKGYKQIDLSDDEIVTSVKLKKTKDQFKLYKVAIRKDLDISAVTFAARFQIDNGIIKKFSLALGGVGPIVLRIPEIEKELLEKSWERKNFIKASQMVPSLITPLSDLRGSSKHRLRLCQNLLIKLHDEVARELSPKTSFVVIL